ncbi:MAG: protocatechuate 3,4-dioxygenase subunit alpha [Saprospiraceae bacterium]|nr:protocatechuate 3,4-dioxygenase subunit alpha [Saprospiraceae bacterium]
MKKKLQTPSQTVGPFFAYGLTPEQYSYNFSSWVDGDMVADPHGADVITIGGNVFDGEGMVIPDAMLEVWQHDNRHSRFGRFGTGTDKANRFIFRTTKPLPKDGHAPFLTVVLFMRGQLIHSFTRMYFSDEQELNQRDETLLTVPEERRHTLVAQKKGSFYEFNIHMQGDDETVFFDF